MQDLSLKPFKVAVYETKYQVLDSSHNTWLESSYAQTAEHYMDLLNKAYKLGFTQGYRQGKERPREG